MFFSDRAIRMTPNGQMETSLTSKLYLASQCTSNSRDGVFVRLKFPMVSSKIALDSQFSPCHCPLTSVRCQC